MAGLVLRRPFLLRRIFAGRMYSRAPYEMYDETPEASGRIESSPLSSLGVYSATVPKPSRRIRMNLASICMWTLLHCVVLGSLLNLFTMFFGP